MSRSTALFGQGNEVAIVSENLARPREIVHGSYFVQCAPADGWPSGTARQGNGEGNTLT